MDKSPKVIVLILNYNGKHLLEEAIVSYQKNKYPNFEIVVIDNGSEDNSEKFINDIFPGLKVLRIEKNRGYSGGFNYGLDYVFNVVKADHAIVSNNDVYADENLIAELVKTANDNERVGFVVGKVLFYDSKDIIQTVGMKYDELRLNGGHIGYGEKDEGQYDKTEERFLSDDVFALITKNLYTEVGGYDEEFVLQAEQFDWQMRAKEKGFKIVFTPDAKLWHKDSMTIGRHSATKLYYDARNPMIVLMKYLEPAKFKKYFWVHFWIDTFRSSLVNMKNGDINIAINIWKGFISGVIWGIKNKKLTLKHII